jgi:hypothetical protein
MPRYELKGDPISVAFGYDHATGFFLSVTDIRLKWSKYASDAVNKVTSSIGIKDGG